MSLELIQASIEIFFSWFKSDAVAISIFLTFIGTGLVLFISSFLSIRPFYNKLREINAYFNEIYAGQKSSTEFRAAFSDNYGNIDELLRDNETTSKNYSEYRETIFEQDGMYCNSMRPQVYMLSGNEESLPFLFRLAKSTPNYFVGFGLLFTFIGLVAALFFASEQLSPEAIQDAGRDSNDVILAMLGIASFKFLASIGGLFSSLLIQALTSFFDTRVNDELRKVCENLEEGMLTKTSESLQNQMVQLQTDQLVQLEKFNTEFVIQLSEKLQETAFQPLQNTINDLAGNLGDLNQEALSKAFGEFRKGLSAAVGQEMEATASNLRELQQSFQNLPDQMNDINKSVEESIAKSSETLKERLNEGFDEAQAKLTNLSDTWAEGVSGAVQGVLEDFGSAGSAINEEISHAGENLRASMDEAGMSMVNASQQVNDQLNNAANELRDSLLEAGNAFGENFTTLTSELRTSTQQFSSTFQTFLSQLEQTLSQQQSALERLGEVSNQMSSTSENFVASSENLRVLMNEISQIGTSISQLNNSLEMTAKDFEVAGSDMTNRFGNISNNLDDIFASFKEGTDQQLATVQEFTTELSSVFNTSVGRLQDAIDRLADEQEN